jgi:hypothetical protein
MYPHVLGSTCQQPWPQPAHNGGTPAVEGVALAGNRNSGLSSSCRQRGLTIRSKGAPTACHQAWAVGAGTFSTAQAWRPTVVAPLAQTLGRTEIGRTATKQEVRLAALAREVRSVGCLSEKSPRTPMNLVSIEWCSEGVSGAARQQKVCFVSQPVTSCSSVFF